jgi:two-component system, NtrC family, nitrogen regulation response regulator GlnG
LSKSKVSEESSSTLNEALKPALVLVVDDEPTICWAFERLLKSAGHSVVTASSAEEGLRIAAEQKPDVVVLDVRLPKMDGISALPNFLEATDGAPVVVMTAFGDLETAVNAVQNGASDYLIKPFRLEDAERSIRNAIRASHSSTQPITPNRGTQNEPIRIVGTSAPIQQAFRQIAFVAASDLSVLITGETGTGKELVAAAIHRHSRRSTAPYFPIAPVALNAELIESELFGHVKGAFTGATSDRAGLFERAEGGTVLLDEIGDLPLGVQVKLLRVLEQGDYCRVGDVQPRKCDVRILAATNCELHSHVAAGRFREDLFYRLNGLHIHLPPLRERVEDIAPLCEYFLQRLNYADGGRAMDSSLLQALQKRDWQGNVRELRNAVEHAAVVARGRPLAIEDFPPPQSAPKRSDAAPSETLDEAISRWANARLNPVGGASEAGISQAVTRDGLHQDLLAAIEPPLFRMILEHTRGNRAKTAELLGIHRGTLRDKLRLYGLEDFSSK